MPRYPEVICVLGGYDCSSKKRLSDITCVSLDFNSRWQPWQMGQLPNGEALSLASALVAEDGRIYFIGGWRQDDTVSSSTFIYEISSSRWSIGPRLNMCRCLFGICIVGWKIYVIGGWGSKNGISPRKL
ncbi:unnamed protein product [Protopolystoma xenopodis]|uniref:Uncharacterized protein n=1 Tax=Protopolystoma xenopodis TaxID=117903 RepID=A0A3S5CQF5_9PLAT|nr:unnamed protein product [Protopolystoma xenopodis]